MRLELESLLPEGFRRAFLNLLKDLCKVTLVRISHFKGEVKIADSYQK
jgi:hypothetical protein